MEDPANTGVSMQYQHAVAKCMLADIKQQDVTKRLFGHPTSIQVYRLHQNDALKGTSLSP